jgi:predicted nuclease of predicted toxin-antitoxin system
VRILIDECVHVGVKAAFPGHAVKTVTETAWRGSKDGSLLAYAQEHFDVFVTIDRRLERQHNLKKLRLGFVFVRVPSNEIGSYQPIFAALKKATESVKAGELIQVVNPQMRG